jgi:hypothetical protein
VTLRGALVAVVLVAGAFRSQAQTATVREFGPGTLGRLLQNSLDAPHRLVSPGPDRWVLSRDSTYGVTVIVLNRTAVVEGKVHGDVIVVGADLFIHPGAQVDGRALAIGGGVYPSLLAIVRGGSESYRDVTFDVSESPGRYELSYRALLAYPSPPVTFPGLYGLRLTTYDRSNGVSVPVAPFVSLDSSRIIMEPALSYRSNLGKVDPSVNLSYQPSRRFHARAIAGRATLTNESWIWGDLVNSLSVLVDGIDTRNYYRADRAQLTLHRLWEGAAVNVEPFIGARWERAWSVGPESLTIKSPWTFFDRKEPDNILRPNPPIDAGHIASVLVGTALNWESQGVRLTMRVTGEGSFAAPRDQRFTQAVIDGILQFPTFAGQSYVLDVHMLATAAADSTPRQRWGWLGGTGTFRLIPLLSLGGDELFFLENDYIIPLQKVNVAYLGIPAIIVRYMIGSAGVQELPSFQQQLSLGAALSFFRAELRIDPARRSAQFGVGLSVTR